MALSRRHEIFIDEYLTHWNATRAACAAGYSSRSARTTGWRLIKMPEVVEAIRQRLEALTMSSDEVLVRLTEQARAEYAAYLRSDGTVDLQHLLADGKGHLVKGYRFTNRGDLMVEFHDAQAALVQIGKARAMFVDRAEVTGAEGEPLLDVRALLESRLSRIAANTHAADVPGQSE